MHEIKDVLNHAICVGILLGGDFLLRWILPPTDGHAAAFWLHSVLEWGSVAAVVLLTWICLVKLLKYALRSTRDLVKPGRGRS